MATGAWRVAQAGGCGRRPVPVLAGRSAELLRTATATCASRTEWNDYRSECSALSR